MPCDRQKILVHADAMVFGLVSRSTMCGKSVTHNVVGNETESPYDLIMRCHDELLAGRVSSDPPETHGTIVRDVNARRFGVSIHSVWGSLQTGVSSMNKKFGMESILGFNDIEASSIPGTPIPINGRCSTFVIVSRLCELRSPGSVGRWSEVAHRFRLAALLRRSLKQADGNSAIAPPSSPTPNY